MDYVGNIFWQQQYITLGSMSTYELVLLLR